MKITLEEMKKVHQVQIGLFSAFCKVCENMNLQYFLVHGSLLGTIQNQGFIPFDDDIDVAMLRKDYDRLIRDGQQYLPEYYFLQSHETEKQFPLSFSKLRDSRTTFIQPILNRCDVNKGVYIDIFPIDYFPEGNFSRISLFFQEKLLNFRVNAFLLEYENVSALRKSLFIISKLLIPSWEKAVDKRVKLNTRHKESHFVILTGAKTTERGIPAKWFSSLVEKEFEGRRVSCPVSYDAYLKKIYGEYTLYDPSEKYKNDDNTVSISASVVDVDTSYQHYL